MTLTQKLLEEAVQALFAPCWSLGDIAVLEGRGAELAVPTDGGVELRLATKL